MLFRIKSPAGYEHVRRAGLLPLPSQSTLRRLLHGMSSHLGFNAAAVEAIHEEVASKKGLDRMIVLSFDEMSIQASLSYNCETFAFDGFTKLSDDPVYTGNGLRGQNRKKQENEKDTREAIVDDVREYLADHALIFMARSLTSNWVQPFGVFASKSAASGHELFKLLMSAIVRLDAVGVDVAAVVCDGAQNNKSVWKQCCVNIENVRGEERVNNSIAHPCRLDNQLHRNIRFLADPPHLFKCVRNHMWNHVVVQVIGYSHVVTLTVLLIFYFGIVG